MVAFPKIATICKGSESGVAPTNTDMREGIFGDTP